MHSSKILLLALSAALLATAAHAAGRGMLQAAPSKQSIPCDASVSSGCVTCSNTKAGLTCTGCGEEAYMNAAGQCRES